MTDPAFEINETDLKIYREFRRNVPVDVLAREFNRTADDIRRVVRRIRAERIDGFALGFIENMEFYRSDADENILCATEKDERDGLVPVGKAKSNILPCSASPSSWQMVGFENIPMLNAAEELQMFRKMNFLKYKAATLRNDLDSNHPDDVVMSRIESLYDQAVAIKKRIVVGSLRLIISIAKRYVGVYSDLIDLISDGNLILLQAVEKFDYGRGNRFSTYLTWAITHHFGRKIPSEKKYRDRFLVGDDVFWDSAVDNRSDGFTEERLQQERETQVEQLLQELDEREKNIIVKRFGIGPSQEVQTLNEVGIELGVSKERVHQIEARALQKLRKVAKERRFDFPEAEPET